MKRLTFKEFFYCITENVEQEILKLQQQISNLEAQKFARTKPLDDAIGRLRTILAQKQRQKATSNQTKPSTQTPQGSQITTPGSTGSATPGIPR